MPHEPATRSAPRKRRARTASGLISLGLLLGMAGVVGPGVAGEVEQVRRQGAVNDMQSIVGALRDYSRDTLTLPTGVEGRTNLRWLSGPGNLPAGLPFTPGADDHRALHDLLQTPALGGAGWRGPYLVELPVDPWERAFLVSVGGLVDGRSFPMVVSAGPDGVLDTPPTARAAVGDDLLLPLN